MKNIFYTTFFGTLLLFTNITCEKEKNPPNPNLVYILNTTVVNGKWKIIQFNENNIDETKRYLGYRFTFNSGGTLLCNKIGCNIVGSWLGKNENNELELTLNFGTTTPHQELNKDWYVKQINSTLLKLEDMSITNGKTTYLTFTKAS